MEEVAKLSQLAEEYQKKGLVDPDINWSDLLKAHTLFNACHQRSPERKWQEAAYNVQALYWREDVDISCDVQERITAELVSQLKGIRLGAKDSLQPLGRLISNWDCKTDNLDSSYNKRNSKEFCSTAENMSTNCNDKLKLFARNIIERSVQLCKIDMPCKFAAVAMGSLAKGESTPFSDLEFMFIIERKDVHTVKYFELLAMTVYFLIGNLQETKLKYMNIKELKGFEDLGKNGFKIDGLQTKAGNIPTGNGTAEQKNKFILTVDELTKKYQSVLDDPDPIESLKGDFTAMLAHTALLYGDKELLQKFESAKEKMMVNNARKNAHTNMLRQDINDYDFLPMNTMRENFYRVNLKSDIYRYPSILIYNLKIIYGIKSESSWETLNKLLEMQLVSESFYHSLRLLLASAQYIRMAAYLHHDSQNEQITFLQKSDIKDVTSLERLWHMPRSLVVHMSLHLIPVKKIISHGNQFNVLATLQNVVRFDKELTSARIHYYMEEYEESSRILEKRVYVPDQHWEIHVEELSMLFHSYLLLRQGHKMIRIYKLCEESDIGCDLDPRGSLDWDVTRAGVYACAGFEEKTIQILGKVKKSLVALATLPHSSEVHQLNAERYLFIANIYCSMKRYSEDAECLRLSWEAYSNMDDSIGKKGMREYRARYFQGKGAMLTGRGENYKSLVATNRSLEEFQGLFGSASVEYNMAYCYHNLATAYTRLGDDIEAINNYKEAIKMLAAIHREDEVIYMTLAFSYDNISDEAGMEASYQKAYQILASNPVRSPQNERDLAETISALAGIRHTPQRIQEAIDYLQKGISLCSAESYQGAVGVSVLNYDLGDVYTDLHQYDKALPYLQKAISVKPCETDKSHIKSLFNGHNTIARILISRLPRSLDQSFEDIREHYRNALSLVKRSTRKWFHKGQIAKTYILLAQTFMSEDRERTHSLLVKAFQLTSTAADQNKPFILFYGATCTNALSTLESVSLIFFNLIHWYKINFM